MNKLNPHLYRNKYLRMLPEVYGLPITINNLIDNIQFKYQKDCFSERYIFNNDDRPCRFSGDLTYLTIFLPCEIDTMIGEDYQFNFILENINHEYLHMILYFIESKKASIMFDNNGLGYKIGKWLKKYGKYSKLF